MKNKKLLWITLGIAYLGWNYYRMYFKYEKINILGLPRKDNVISGHYKSLIFEY